MLPEWPSAGGPTDHDSYVISYWLQCNTGCDAGTLQAPFLSPAGGRILGSRNWEIPCGISSLAVFPGCRKWQIAHVLASDVPIPCAFLWLCLALTACPLLWHRTPDILLKNKSRNPVPRDLVFPLS